MLKNILFYKIYFYTVILLIFSCNSSNKNLQKDLCQDSLVDLFIRENITGLSSIKNVNTVEKLKQNKDFMSIVKLYEQIRDKRKLAHTPQITIEFQDDINFKISLVMIKNFTLKNNIYFNQLHKIEHLLLVNGLFYEQLDFSHFQTLQDITMTNVCFPNASLVLNNERVTHLTFNACNLENLIFIQNNQIQSLKIINC